MTAERLKKIIYNSTGLMWSEAWENLIYKQNSFVPVREQDLYSVNFGRKSGYLTFDYRVLGLEFIEGKVTGAGVSMTFMLAPYEYVRITTEYSPADGLFNYVLIMPKYKPEHWIGRKSISQRANIIRNEKEFIRYQKRIGKRFN